MTTIIAGNKIDPIQLLIDCSGGHYIPKYFHDCYDPVLWNISEEYFNDLDDPSNELYFDSWSYIIDNAYFVDDYGLTWNLYQDADLFMVCYEIMTDEQYKEFFGEDR
jgi:hypothetical protein